MSVDADHLVCHCLLIEAPDGLVLVDSGLGRHQARDPRSLPLAFRAVARPDLREEETAAALVEGLGFRVGDVRHVVLTHLDLDHAGGLPDFPSAEVHVRAEELEAALRPRTWFDGHRYLASAWAHTPRFRAYDGGGERWRGFSGVRALEGLPPEILWIPMEGHSRGHAGVAVEVGGGRWQVHCGDGYFHRNELRGERAPWGLALFGSFTSFDRRATGHNLRRLAELASDPAVTLFSSHDPTELDQSRFT